jgi:SAM-dependent methyltransferase
MILCPPVIKPLLISSKSPLEPNTNFSENKTMWIEENFRKLFRELEDGHLDIRERLNRFSKQDSNLLTLLTKEVDKFEAWRFPLMDSLAAIVFGLDADQQEAHKNFIRDSKYFEIVQAAPFYWRIVHKPNGYAGDAHMMNFIYQNQYEGDTPFGMMLHKHALATKACESVRNRKTYLFEQILQKGKGNILSLAAGPAQEISEVLKTAHAKQYRFLALDHDMETLKKFSVTNSNPYFKYALANAFQIISDNYLTARPRQFLERFCSPRKDFDGLRVLISPIKYELNYLKKEEFDLVYSSGLYDYIMTFPLDDSKGTVALTKNLFNLVKPGGTLIVGNFNHNNPRDLRFIMEYVYDWRLIYRSEKDMLEFARSIPEKQIKNIQVENEPLGINYFLKIEKA